MIRFLQKPMITSIGFILASLLSIIISKVPWKIGQEEQDVAIIKLHVHEPTVVIKKSTATQKRSSTPVSREASPFPVFVDGNVVAANTRARKPHVEPVLLGEGGNSKKPSSGNKKVIYL